MSSIQNCIKIKETFHRLIYLELKSSKAVLQQPYLATTGVYEESLLLVFVEQLRSRETLQIKKMAHKKRDDTWFE